VSGFFVENPLDRQFFSPTLGKVSRAQVVERLAGFLDEDPEANYRIVIGSDSQNYNHHGVDFVSALVIHRIGRGGIYFWQKRVESRVFSLAERIYQEALDSLLLAQALLEELKNRNVLHYSFEIHVDVGQVGETRELIDEVVGMIRGNGFAVKTKPDSYAASKVADRHT